MTSGLAGARLAAVVCAGLMASSCAVYHARPLPAGPDIQPAASGLKVDIGRLRVAPLKPILVDARDGLDPLEVAVLAVLNSPDLAAKRAALGVKGAEAFAAGLLPDPQISVSQDRPVSGPDTQTAYAISPSLDVAALLASASAHRAARFTARQADLDVLWAEWTTAQQARQFAETALADEARGAYLRKVLAAAADRYARSTRALANHDVTLQTNAADLAAKLDAETQMATAVHDAAKARRDLNALLNLEASVVLPLVPGPPVQTYDPAAVQAALGSLPTRRPDLLALQAGYRAQDANVRKAVIAQFPLASIAYAYAKDPAGTTTQGLSAVLALPIFGNRRADVKVQDATREQLRAEYQARLDQTQAEVRNAQAELAGARAQAAVLRTDVPRLEALAAPAVRAYDRGDIDSQTYLTLIQNVLSKRADLDDRELAARLAEIQLETALFLPPATSRTAP
ncbi:TolC family protein [Phenylobacterium sp.]|uniref:TolC family protein n=1 Tax=Phenylobacterium sp. TaxID=1871053 RepID=UPI002DEC42CB|nr:TolC family protein [Phenylobacterium sp.]